MNISVFASHNGTNLQAIIDAVESGVLKARVAMVITNNSGSGAAARAKKHGIPLYHLSSASHPDSAALDVAIVDALRTNGTDVVFLAGYMKKLGEQTLAAYRGRILNTHPALLPKFGGKGMYGMHVHTAVVAAGERESGISVHLVDGEYDTGRVLAQARVPVIPGDTADTLCERVMKRERKFIVEVLADIVAGNIALDIP
ncbi:MAG: phosphoribosylglycinamide formyltransferase [Spirochaetes bacterium]|nr:phosphoribosylglycinamide formyltransferase [Spirochaetota bacterium]